MVDNLALLISHGALLYVIWRIATARDPEDRGDIRFTPAAQASPAKSSNE